MASTPSKTTKPRRGSAPGDSARKPRKSPNLTPEQRAAKAERMRKLSGDTSRATAAMNQKQERLAHTAVEKVEADGVQTEALDKIKQELASRELAKRELLGLVLRHEPQYQPGWVHRDISEKLSQFMRDVEEKKSPRLILTVPPRHGKSLLASQYFPAWVMGHHPEWEFIATSHTATLAEKFSRRVREVLRSKTYQVVFNKTELDPDSQSVQQWNTTRGGGLLAAGVGGAILGSGADILLVDDPVKNAEQAGSEGSKEAIWEWFATTAYTRLAPGGGVIVIMQRWAEDDLAGLLERGGPDGDGDKYTVIRYPAIAEEDEAHRKAGEALHPERYPLAMLEAIKSTLSPWMWSALYQQRPTVQDGDYFTKDMIVYYDDHELPEQLTYYGAWDFAISKKERADRTVGIAAGLDEHDDLWITDIEIGRWKADEIVERILDLWERHPFDMMGGEEGQIKLALGPYLEQRAQERRMYDFALEPLKPGRRDKESRARTAQALMRRRKVRLPRNHPRIQEVVDELLAFPNGVHDDAVDAIAYLCLMLNDMVFRDDKPRDTGSPKQDQSGYQSRLAKILARMRGRRERDWRAA